MLKNLTDRLFLDSIESFSFLFCKISDWALLEYLACQIAWAPNRRYFAEIRASLCRPHLLIYSSLMFGWVIIFSSQVSKSSVTSILVRFAFALSVLSAGIDTTNFTLGNCSRIYCLSDCNEIRTHNYLVHERTLNHLTKLV